MPIDYREACKCVKAAAIMWGGYEVAGRTLQGFTEIIVGKDLQVIIQPDEHDKKILTIKVNRFSGPHNGLELLNYPRGYVEKITVWQGPDTITFRLGDGVSTWNVTFEINQAPRAWGKRGDSREENKK